MDNAILLDKVGICFDTVSILEDVSLKVSWGEFVCLLGPSGCGKSTLLRMIGGLLAPTCGTVSIDGMTPSHAKRNLAFVFQSPRLMPWHTALGNVVLGIQLRSRISRREAQSRGLAALALVGLTEHAHHYPAALSGGQRQRVAIARAWAVDPDVVLMDEPFSALDPGTRHRLREETLSLWEKAKKTVIFVTHDVDEAVYLADRIVLLAGRPATISETITVSEPRPRQLAAPVAQALHRRIRAHFNERPTTSHLLEEAA
jgi:NitT/TauT family transport system ATP-binding protein